MKNEATTFDHSHFSWRECIVAAAVKYGDVVAFVPKPGRHHTVTYAVYNELGARTGGNREQGFVTNFGRFVDREEGLAIARASSQIKQKHGNQNLLFSEDMW